MRFKFTLQAIPVCLAALCLWAVIGGWYVAVAPLNLSGPDNIGIVLSTFGLCLFLADRLAYSWLNIQCWVLILKTWAWGTVFMAWGLREWLHSFSRQYLAVFIVHWTVLLTVVVLTWLYAGRRQRLPK